MFDNSFCTVYHIGASVCATYYIFSLCITGYYNENGKSVITRLWANLWDFASGSERQYCIPVLLLDFFPLSPWQHFSVVPCHYHKTAIYHSNKARICLKEKYCGTVNKNDLMNLVLSLSYWFKRHFLIDCFLMYLFNEMHYYEVLFIPRIR